MKDVDYSNQIQKEAILNEFKGNLFEFLVAQGLARKSAVEHQFLLDLPGEFRERLSAYEEMIRTHEPRLLVKLPTLAALTVEKIWQELHPHYDFKTWHVIGKLVATNDNELWNETDIVGSYLSSEGVSKQLALSLKLTKDHSFVNTKSAGVKSFLAKYFALFGAVSARLQSELNQEVDESFLQMGHRLYALADLEWRGQFDKSWIDHYPELPGELSPEMRSVVHENYYRIAFKLRALLDQLQRRDSALFFDSLFALCGFGHEDIIQVNCFHQDYELKTISFKRFAELFLAAEKKAVILPLKDLSSSVDIQIGKVNLQVRVKPMNKFTTAAYKINCSIKVKE